ELEELELAQRESELLTVEEHLVRVEVEPKPPALEDLVGLSGLLRVAATEDGAHPGDELARAERLGHVVVGAELEPEHPVHLPGPCGEHHDRESARRLGSAEPAADLEAVDAGQHEIEYDQGRPIGLEAREGTLPRVRLPDIIAVLLEVEADEL